MSTLSAPQLKESYAPFVESDADAGAEELRARMDETGYLFFRSLAPEQETLRVRREVLELCAQAGWLDPSHDLMDAVAAPGTSPLMEGMKDYMPVYRQILRTPSFHDFPTLPQFLKVAQKLLDVQSLDEVFVHPRRIGRVTWPNFVSAATPPHQDHHYIRGSVDTFSCWLPLGACPTELGGLAILPGSHQTGFHEHTISSPGVGGAGVPLDDETFGRELKWHISDFEVGDTLFFHSFTVHKAMPNLTKDRLRISTDNRYQRPKDDIDSLALKPHFE